MNDPDWMSSAACKTVDPDVFFPGVGSGTEIAKRFCRANCPEAIRQQCGDYAVENHIEFGVWGGMSERERRRLARRRVSLRQTA